MTIESVTGSLYPEFSHMCSEGNKSVKVSTDIRPTISCVDWIICLVFIMHNLLTYIVFFCIIFNIGTFTF